MVCFELRACCIKRHMPCLGVIAWLVAGSWGSEVSTLSAEAASAAVGVTLFSDMTTDDKGDRTDWEY